MELSILGGPNLVRDIRRPLFRISWWVDGQSLNIIRDRGGAFRSYPHFVSPCQSVALMCRVQFFSDPLLPHPLWRVLPGALKVKPLDSPLLAFLGERPISTTCSQRMTLTRPFGRVARTNQYAVNRPHEELVTS